MSPLDALSAKLSAVRERQDAAFARRDGVALDATARSADDIFAVMAVFASRSLGDLAVKARALGAFPDRHSSPRAPPSERSWLRSAPMRGDWRSRSYLG